MKINMNSNFKGKIKKKGGPKVKKVGALIYKMSEHGDSMDRIKNYVLSGKIQNKNVFSNWGKPSEKLYFEASMNVDNIAQYTSLAKEVEYLLKNIYKEEFHHNWYQPTKGLKDGFSLVEVYFDKVYEGYVVYCFFIDFKTDFLDDDQDTWINCMDLMHDSRIKLRYDNDSDARKLELTHTKALAVCHVQDETKYASYIRYHEVWVPKGTVVDSPEDFDKLQKMLNTSNDLEGQLVNLIILPLKF